MPIPNDFSYIRYLAAKKSVDDRALNRQVMEAVAQTLRPLQENGPLKLLEVGCGIGTMIERLWDLEILTNADYIAVDLLPENIAEAKTRLPAFAHGRGVQFAETEEGQLLLTSSHQSLRVILEAIDVFDFAARENGQSAWDVVLAHAFLDLVDLESAVPRLFGLLKPGGWFYFTLNFDGTTLFLPPLDQDLDDLIEKLYHSTMDNRRMAGRPSGSSRTGRLLFSVLPRFGGRILAAGSSDWVVFPDSGRYVGDEAYFLHYLVHTVHSAVSEQPLLLETPLDVWASHRHQQIEQGQLSYVAHQLDFFGIKER